MHIVMFLDQHPESLGGAQLSARLQRRFLERDGARVSMCAPRSFRRGGTTDDPGYILTPALAITADREYSITWPTRRVDALLDAWADTVPAIDIVHIQADFWQAAIGLRFARRHSLPVVITLHNRLDVGIESTIPFPRLALWALGRIQRAWLGRPQPDAAAPRQPAWRFLRRLTVGAQAVIAPSAHFAALMVEAGVAATIDVIPTGVDDDLLAVTSAAVRERVDQHPVFVWAGRMSGEKRLMEFLEALARARPAVHVRLYGSGQLRAEAERFVRKNALIETVAFEGQVEYPQMLAAIASADALVQTSLGFETQGMTVSEAIALGTPALLCDPAIAAELPDNSYWLTTDGSVESLASVLTLAARQLADGTAPVPSARDTASLRESARVAELEAVYSRVLRDAP